MPNLGDYGCVRTPGLAAWLIRLGTRSRVNHAFVFVGDGWIIEARPGGAATGHVTEYTNIVWSSVELADSQRAGIAAAAKSLIGVPYGWVDIAALACACYGIRNRWIDRRIQREDRLICSQLCDRAYELAGIHLFADGRLDCEVTPQDLLALVAATRLPGRQR